MRIVFEDDHGNFVAMECTSVSVQPDPDADGRWVLLAMATGAQVGTIIRTGMTKADAMQYFRKIFALGCELCSGV